MKMITNPAGWKLGGTQTCPIISISSYFTPLPSESFDLPLENPAGSPAATEKGSAQQGPFRRVQKNLGSHPQCHSASPSQAPAQAHALPPVPQSGVRRMAGLSQQ